KIVLLPTLGNPTIPTSKAIGGGRYREGGSDGRARSWRLPPPPLASIVAPRGFFGTPAPCSGPGSSAKSTPIPLPCPLDHTPASHWPRWWHRGHRSHTACR